MKKQVLAFFLAFLATSSALSVQQSLRSSSLSQKVEIKHRLVNKIGVNLCPLCIQFTDQAIQELVEIIANVGIVGSCGELCGYLEQATGSQILGAACTILCDVAGIREFINLIDKADLDPIYFCEELDACPIFDGGDATITKITIDPVSGPQGTKNIEIDWTSKNGTGTGELIVEVRTLDGIPVESGFLQEPQAAGSYSKQLSLKAQPDPDCDPSQQPCEMWLPGNYTVIAVVCNGECGSKHPHSKIYDRKQANFTITP